MTGPALSKKIYVGNFPAGTTQRELRALLSSFGPLESVHIDPRKGVASVEVGKVARALLSRLTLRGATLSVKEG